ncbi:MAG: AgmX/PglI C-terminal domain-containing protein [Minicystis sp.]
MRSIDVAAGASEAGAQRCQVGGNACTPLEAGAELTGDYEIRTAAGARVWLDLGDGATLEMAGHANAAFAGGARPGVRFERGAFAIETPAGRALGVRVEAGERALSLDPAMPAAIAVRATDRARADLTVRRGRLTAGEGAAAVELRSGDSAHLRGDRPIERGVATTLDPELDPRRDDHLPTDADKAQPRGLGTMTARIPGTADVVSGVRLVSHRVNVVVRDGFARTEVEEEFANDTSRVLEGRYVFPVPPDASLSRLALWVGKDLVEGEMVERERAATIFKSIVDDSVRPRDPALLEWTSGSELSLKVFPLPPHGSRKVVLAYDQAISLHDGRARYVYPLSLGADRATKIDDFEIRVVASDSSGPLGEAETPGYAASISADRGGLGAGFHAKAFTPAADFVLAFDAPIASARPAAMTIPAMHTVTPNEGADRFVAVRVPVEWPAGASPPARVRRDRAVVVDVSHSQSKETLAGEIAVAEGVIAALDPDERFVLLACDSACVAFPEDGLAPASEASLEQARSWLRKRTIGGSSDVAGALLAAARRLEPGGAGQLVMLGDGAPTSGELAADTIAARVRPELSAKQIDLRLFGAGRTVDAVVLEGLARALGGAYERLGDGEPLARRIEDLSLALRAPLLRNATITASSGLRDVYPRNLPTLRAGSDVLVLARMDAGATGEIRLSGDLGGVAFAAARPVSAREASPVVPRLWAAARIAELEASSDPAAAADVVALSKRHHVLSRRTSLLVLENDRMFAEFGIPRTQHANKDLQGIASIGGGSAADVGMIGLLRNADPAAPNAPWGRDDSAAPAFSGSVTFGHGGLGLSGVGEGGGGAGTLGAGQGFGSGHGRLGGSHKSSAPQVRMGAVSVSGRLPPEVIQRIVRQNFGRFRLCYENGLRNNPNLAGRVSVRFVIARDGTVSNASNGGSDLPDGGVINCVVRAFFGLTFPEPEGGIITVTYPIMFSNLSSADRGWTAPPHPTFDAGPSATHLPGNDQWMTQGSEAIEKLQKAVEEQGQSRPRHEALIRGLLARGRFADALTAARRFADLDPDLDRARELLAGAAAGAGEAEVARIALDAAVEIAPRNADLHTRAARAFEAAGDEARACAHWRSVAALRPKADDARYQSLRCRARLGDREAVLAEARAEDKPGKQVTALLATLTGGSAPAYDASAASPGVFEATVRCAGESKTCPAVVVIKPSGDVVSPWAPSSSRASARAVALPSAADGVYRTILVGGAPDARGEVVIRAHASTRTFRFDRGGLQTVATTTVQSPGFGSGHR